MQFSFKVTRIQLFVQKFRVCADDAALFTSDAACVLNAVTNTDSAVVMKYSTEKQLYFEKTTLIVSANLEQLYSDSRLIVAHVRILLLIELLKKSSFV